MYVAAPVFVVIIVVVPIILFLTRKVKHSRRPSQENLIHDSVIYANSPEGRGSLQAAFSKRESPNKDSSDKDFPIPKDSELSWTYASSFDPSNDNTNTEELQVVTKESQNVEAPA